MEALMERKACAFSGHRPGKLPWKNNEQDSRCVELKRILSEQIEKLILEGVTGFLSGMAQGTDLWAAQAVLDLREKYPDVELHCIIPYKGQADKWDDSWRELYNSILKKADQIVYVNQDYTDGCLLERNHFLVSNADILLAVYNGAPRSGTAATVRYAQKMQRKIIIIDPATLEISDLE